MIRRFSEWKKGLPISVGIPRIKHRVELGVVAQFITFDFSKKKKKKFDLDLKNMNKYDIILY